eukprot:scaffold14938_cov130-Isochrysis_galbana.AAC.8
MQVCTLTHWRVRRRLGMLPRSTQWQSRPGRRRPCACLLPGKRLKFTQPSDGRQEAGIRSVKLRLSLRKACVVRRAYLCMYTRQHVVKRPRRLQI